MSYYAIRCVHSYGTILSGNPSPEAISQAVDVDKRRKANVNRFVGPPRSRGNWGPEPIFDFYDDPIAISSVELNKICRHLENRAKVYRFEVLRLEPRPTCRFIN